MLSSSIVKFIQANGLEFLSQWEGGSLSKDISGVKGVKWIPIPFTDVILHLSLECEHVKFIGSEGDWLESWGGGSLSYDISGESGVRWNPSLPSLPLPFTVEKQGVIIHNQNHLSIGDTRTLAEFEGTLDGFEEVTPYHCDCWFVGGTSSGFHGRGAYWDWYHGSCGGEQYHKTLRMRKTLDEAEDWSSYSSINFYSKALSGALPSYVGIRILNSSEVEIAGKHNCAPSSGWTKHSLSFSNLTDVKYIELEIIGTNWGWVGFDYVYLDEGYSSGLWRWKTVDDTHIVKLAENSYKAYISGWGSPSNWYPQDEIWSIGEATSESPEGPWTVDDENNPKLQTLTGWGSYAFGRGHVLASMKDPDGMLTYENATYDPDGGPYTGAKIGQTDLNYSGFGTELWHEGEDIIADPYCAKEGDYYYMFYSRKVGNGYQTWCRKAATYSDLASPIWDQCVVSNGGSCSVVLYQGIWYMVYSGYNASLNRNEVHLLKNTVGLDSVGSWEVIASPLFETGTAGIDEHGAQDPSLYLENDIMYVYYGGIHCEFTEANGWGNEDTEICLVKVLGF